MEVQVAETGPCSRSLQITIPSNKIQEHLEEMYKSAAQQVQVKGFRPGKVPRAMIEKLHGESIRAEAKEQLLNRYFGEACRENEIQPVGRIKIDDVEALEVKANEQLTFTAQLDIKPSFEIPSAKDIVIPSFESEANDEDIANALKEIAHQKRKIQPTDEAVEDGDFIKCDYTFHEGDNEVHTRSGVQLNTRIPINGVDQTVYAEALIGGKAGDVREMAIKFPNNFEKEEVRGKDGTVKVKMHEVLRVLPPPIDDEMAKGMEFESLAKMQEDLAVRISSEKQRLGKQRQEEAALEFLSNAAEIPLPPSLIEEQEQASLGAFAQRMKQEGAPEEEIQKKLEESKEAAHEDAQRRVKLFFLVEAVAAQQELSVAEADIQAELANIAAANSNQEQQITPEQVYQHLQSENRLGELQLALLERKVRDFLRENGKTVDKTDS
ncbi:MAG: trigger factor [Planctomycetota bacterium]|jgi:trigger factor